MPKIFLTIFYFHYLFSFCYSSLKFNIPNNREKCFAQELYLEGTLLVRYDLKGIESIKQEYQEQAIKNIKIFVKNEKGKNLHELFLNSPKGKFAVHIQERGMYFICTKYHKTWSLQELPKDVMLGIKLRNDFDYKEIEGSIQKKDLDDFIGSMMLVKRNVIPSIAVSKMELDEEDKTAKAIISTSTLYFKLTIVQMILIIIIAFYQIFNLRKFLASKRII
jgi:hypothetical protein